MEETGNKWHFLLCGVQWLSLQSIKLGSKGCLIKSHRQQSHCVESMSKTLYLLLSTGSNQEEPI